MKEIRAAQYLRMARPKSSSSQRFLTNNISYFSRTHRLFSQISCTENFRSGFEKLGPSFHKKICVFFGHYVSDPWGHR